MKRVVLGMSGGVDSSVAAILLMEQGYEVVGVTFKFIPDFDSSDASNVCSKLGIEHHVIDKVDVFKDEVIDDFINKYKEGLTPNPCVHCNRFVKIKFLYDAMKEYNCDYFATGHYARLDNGKLFRSVDSNKDQTYFLSLVPKEILSHAIFPLEGIDKEDVRKIAEKHGLEVAHKKDSFDVCFIKGKFSDYMSEHVKNNKGNIIDISNNNVVGTHNGLSFYTIGQRKGLNLGGFSNRGYVVGKDINKNILYVSFGDDSEALYSDECILSDCNLLSNEKITNCTAKFRYRSIEYPVHLEYLENNEIKVIYPEKVSSVTPGQTCVFYVNNECVGGGIIKEIRKNNTKLWYL